jgi:glycerophosphoryl diester phosphodiesterase
MKIVGHRGARGLAPENTLASFEKAIEHGVNEIECDVRITSDGVPVMIHDRHVNDPSGNKLRVNQHTHEELKAHKSDLPTLDEAARFVQQRVPMVVEVKPGEKTEPIKETLQQLLSDGWNAEDFRLASFSFKTLHDLHSAFPDIEKVVNDRWSGVRATSRARRLDTKRITMNHRWLWSGFVKAMAGSEYQLNAYTLNDPKKAAHLAKYGLYGVVTDFPDRFEKK